MKALKLMLIFFFSLKGIVNGGIELYMADAEVRIAQKIYCQITGVSPEDKLIVTLDNKIIFQKAGNLQPEEIFIADYRNQTAGQHTLVVTISAAKDQYKESVTKTWTTLHDGIPTVGIDENNAIRVNGDLFFPVYAEIGRSLIEYWVNNKYLNASADMTYINGKSGYSTDYTKEDFETFLNQLENLGIRNIGPTFRWYGMGKPTGQGNDLIVMADYVESLKDHPGVLMWQWADEPDRGGDPARGGDAAYPSEIRSWHEVVHQHDTNHPHAVNLTAYDWARDRIYSVEHCGDYSYLYGFDWHEGEKKLVGDVIGFDFYPIEFATKVPEKNGNLEVSFETMVKAIDRLKEWNYNLCPIFSWNEPCDLNPDEDGDGYADGHSWSPYLWTPQPTQIEFWAEYWIKIIHGIKGFKLHPYFDPAGIACPPANHETMTKFIKWIDELRFVVLGKDYNGEVVDKELNGGRIDIMVKEFDNFIFIFSGNLKYKKEKVQFNINGLSSNTRVEVFGENRSIVTNSGYFEDYFDTLAVHIYKIAKNTLGVSIKSDCDFSVKLIEAFPNPFNIATTISYSVIQNSHIQINIFNSLGQLIVKLVDEEKSIGNYNVKWSGNNYNNQNVPTGIYFCQLKANKIVFTSKMLLLR